jgi:hypothetical protein
MVSNKGPLVGFAALVAVLGIGVTVGGVVGVGPLAATTPPDQVTDPREMIARSLQSTLDAFSVHLDASVSGTIPGALVDRSEGAVVLDGTVVSADLKPRDARTQAAVDSAPLGIDLDTVTVWDSVWSRTAPDGPWTKASLGSVTAGSGLDLNPLTIVDRLRDHLRGAGGRPTVKDVACAGSSGTCRHIVLDAGTDPATLLAALLPDENAAALPVVHTVVTLDSDAATLRPARLVLEMTSEDGSMDLRLVIDASRWDEPVMIEEPPSGS